MSLSLADIQTLMNDLNESSLREFSMTTDDLSLHMSKNEAVVQPTSQSNTVAESTEDAVEAPFAKTVAGATIDAPLVGTVYLKPSPDAQLFKHVGDHVAIGEQVAIIEAMKLMTPVKSEVAGTIVEVLIEEEEVVDYGKPLFRIELDA
jgi:acetyl-CoA carboxylase biotin carboxyl carrier protein